MTRVGISAWAGAGDFCMGRGGGFLYEQGRGFLGGDFCMGMGKGGDFCVGRGGDFCIAS